MNRTDEEAMSLTALGVMLAVILSAFLAAPAHGSPPLGQPMVPGQWNRNTHLWLARSLVGEAGWKSVDDHVAIMNILRRRWQRLEQQVPGTPFVVMVRQYAAGMSASRTRFSPRTTWVRALPYTMPATAASMQDELNERGWAGLVYRIPPPIGWPAHLDWAAYLPRWNRVLERSNAWAQGRYADKCPEALHWGAPSGVDMVRAMEAGWTAVDCGDTLNRFWRSKR